MRFLILEIIKFSKNKNIQKFFLYSLAVLFSTYMLLWNWQIVLATTAGVGIMVTMYVLQTSPAAWKIWQNCLSGLNRKLVISVVSGGIAAIATFCVTLLWSDSEKHWLALVGILQGLGTLLVIFLLGWQIWDKDSKRNVFDSYLTDLTHSDPLRRIIAIRNLATLHDSRHPIQEYYRIMLTRENDTIVKKTLLEVLSQDKQPLNIPLKYKT